MDGLSGIQYVIYIILEYDSGFGVTAIGNPLQISRILLICHPGVW